jgi:hypothetical protein
VAAIGVGNLVKSYDGVRAVDGIGFEVEHPLQTKSSLVPALSFRGRALLAQLAVPTGPSISSANRRMPSIASLDRE